MNDLLVVEMNRSATPRNLVLIASNEIGLARKDVDISRRQTVDRKRFIRAKLRPPLEPVHVANHQVVRHGQRQELIPRLVRVRPLDQIDKIHRSLQRVRRRVVRKMRKVHLAVTPELVLRQRCCIDVSVDAVVDRIDGLLATVRRQVPSSLTLRETRGKRNCWATDRQTRRRV